MAAIKMDGKALAAKVKEEVAAQVAGMADVYKRQAPKDWVPVDRTL